MLKLYRGLVDILKDQCDALSSAFTTHIRQFNSGVSENNNFGVKGFWNLLLEITYILFVKLFVTIGIFLTVTLAVVFFPLHGILMLLTNIMNHRASFEDHPSVTERVEPKNV